MMYGGRYVGVLCTIVLVSRVAILNIPRAFLTLEYLETLAVDDLTAVICGAVVNRTEVTTVLCFLQADDMAAGKSDF